MHNLDFELTVLVQNLLAPDSVIASAVEKHIVEVRVEIAAGDTLVIGAAELETCFSEGVHGRAESVLVLGLAAILVEVAEILRTRQYVVLIRRVFGGFAERCSGKGPEAVGFACGHRSGQD